jgi:hypothetical protein
MQFSKKDICQFKKKVIVLGYKKLVSAMTGKFDK